jgi:hypothetical protein
MKVHTPRENETKEAAQTGMSTILNLRPTAITREFTSSLRSQEIAKHEANPHYVDLSRQ